MAKIEWDDRMDQHLRHMRDRGQTWHAIALHLQVGRSAVIERARRLGIPPAPPWPSRTTTASHMRADRPCIPPGHPLSWGAIVDGTALDGEPYPFPVFL